MPDKYTTLMCDDNQSLWSTSAVKMSREMEYDALDHHPDQPENESVTWEIYGYYCCQIMERCLDTYYKTCRATGKGRGPASYRAIHQLEALLIFIRKEDKYMLAMDRGRWTHLCRCMGAAYLHLAQSPEEHNRFNTDFVRNISHMFCLVDAIFQNFRSTEDVVICDVGLPLRVKLCRNGLPFDDVEDPMSGRRGNFGGSENIYEIDSPNGQYTSLAGDESIHDVGVDLAADSVSSWEEEDQDSARPAKRVKMDEPRTSRIEELARLSPAEAAQVMTREANPDVNNCDFDSLWEKYLDDRAPTELVASLLRYGYLLQGMCKGTITRERIMNMPGLPRSAGGRQRAREGDIGGST